MQTCKLQNLGVSSQLQGCCWTFIIATSRIIKDNVNRLSFSTLNFILLLFINVRIIDRTHQISSFDFEVFLLIAWTFKVICDSLCKVVAHFNWKLVWPCQVMGVLIVKVKTSWVVKVHEGEFFFLPWCQFLFL
jgi:hypothetical protein